MKMKVLAVVGIVVVIAVAIVACGQTQGNGKPSSVASSSVASSQIVTDVSDLPTDSTIVEDTSLAESVPSAEPVQEQPNKDAVAENETEESISAADAAYDESVIQKLIAVGLTREEAEARLAESREESAEKNAAEADRIAEIRAEEQAQAAEDAKAAHEFADKQSLELYGVTWDELQTLSPDERYQLSYQMQQKNNS